MGRFKKYWRKNRNSMNIVLIGMRGAGKTTVAKLLSKKLKKPYIEMDDLVMQKAGMSTANIVKSHGWEYFRGIESKVARELTKQNDVIISCGGGIVTRAENIKALKKNGKLFWLQANIDTLVKRIGNDQNRPSLTDKPPKEDMEETLAKRYQLYKKAADQIIDTEKLTAKQVADRIIENI